MEKEIELLPFLERVMKRTTKHYQEDFHSDFARLQRAAKDPEDEHILYWMARPCGTWIVTERDAFLKGSFGHAAWTHYADMAAGSNGILEHLRSLGQRFVEPLGPDQEELSLSGQSKALAAAVKKGDAQLTLQLADGAAHGGLGDV